METAPSAGILRMQHVFDDLSTVLQNGRAEYRAQRFTSKPLSGSRGTTLYHPAESDQGVGVDSASSREIESLCPFSLPCSITTFAAELSPLDSTRLEKPQSLQSIFIVFPIFRPVSTQPQMPILVVM